MLVEGIFAAGNVLHVHDLVDYVSQEAAVAGRNAAAYVLGSLEDTGSAVSVTASDGVRYTVPQSIDPTRMPEELTVRFRVGNVYENRFVSVYLDDQRIYHRKRMIMAPGEMEEVVLKKSMFASHPDLKRIFIKVEEA